MNLLKTDTYELVHIDRHRPIPRYAILSHRWEPSEITYNVIATLKPSALTVLRNPSFPSLPPSLHASAAKIRGACAIALQQRLMYIWIDTCCIDKTKSEELRYALSMMFRWYRSAAVCYTYFNDITFDKPSEKMFKSDRADRRGQPSEWFERGWTLQELLAPQKMQFYDKRWKYMGTRHELASLVGEIAGIHFEYLNGERNLSEASCATKMSWMAGRVTSLVEDVAYSLIGLFDVDLLPIYGEGTKAFIRLQEAIMHEFGRFDESLFAWKRPQDGILQSYRHEPRVQYFKHDKWGLFAPSPDCFKNSGNIVVKKDLVHMRPNGDFRLSHQGIVFSLPSTDVKHRFGGLRNEINFPLQCWRNGSGGVSETIVLKLARVPNGEIFRAQCNNLTSQKGVKISSKGGVVIAVAQPRLDMCIR